MQQNLQEFLFHLLYCFGKFIFLFLEEFFILKYKENP